MECKYENIKRLNIQRKYFLNIKYDNISLLFIKPSTGN